MAYNAVAAFRREGGQEFGFHKTAIHEQLASDGLLARIAKSGEKARNKRILGDQTRVLHLVPGALDEFDAAEDDDSEG